MSNPNQARKNAVRRRAAGGSYQAAVRATQKPPVDTRLEAPRDGHAGWHCDAGASVIAEAMTPGPGRLGTLHGAIYTCPSHQAAAEDRIAAAGCRTEVRQAPPSHQWDPWPCGHTTAYTTKATALNAPASQPSEHGKAPTKVTTEHRLDQWQQTDGPARGFPTADYFEAVHDAIVALGIQPESWFQGDPWEGAVVLDEDSLTGTRARGYDEVTVAWRVEQDCEPKHADDFDGEGWYLVYVRGDNRQLREFDTPLPYLAEPEQVADAVTAAIGARTAS